MRTTGTKSNGPPLRLAQLARPCSFYPRLGLARIWSSRQGPTLIPGHPCSIFRATSRSMSSSSLSSSKSSLCFHAVSGLSVGSKNRGSIFCQYIASKAKLCLAA
ncbi:hypothetical protein BO71DRAFT_37164 [Aspergillus ellipticus CBS 707.79]|uniref:Uncharacterized protein n=1 Tax=Aspergillus ellipticus CBS 707.79 TaxID=1448320 RepID=A0A319DUX1_9EURO|nr:hypothetical protein BO71DRAFT_37164 [Aspergillus ellipticus CBS 707.79]